MGKILIVEDDPAIRQLLRVMLETADHEVFEAADGPSALPSARDARPDLVLLDIGLPGIDGFGVLGLLKDDEELRDVPVIMVTAWADPALVARALDRGAHDYVRKPFDVADLGARVEAALRVREESDLLTSDDERPAGPAAHDPLTALPNRAHLVEVLERQAQSARRSGRPFSVALMDLDGLGAINDDLGREVGDDVLRAVAKRLRRRARVSDIVGRWDGEEFLVVAPATDVGGAGVLAEDLRSELAGRPVDTPTAAVRLTISVGVAEFDPGERPEQLLARSAAALAAAKASGRNDVRLAEGDAAPEPSSTTVLA